MPEGNRLSDLDINEISFCENGANQGSKIALIKNELVDYEPEYIGKRSFDTEKRKKLAGKGKAMSDGSFPIENKQDLKNAVKAIGRAPEGKRASVKSHIKRRAKALGATDLLPDDWVSKGCGHDHRKLKRNERCPECGMRSTGKQGRMRKADTIVELVKASSTTKELTDRLSSMMGSQDDGQEQAEMARKIDEINLDELDDNVKAAIEELVADNETLSEGLEKSAEAASEAEKELEELKAAGSEDDDDGDEDEDDLEKILAKSDLPSNVRTALAKIQEEAEQNKIIAREALMKAEQERTARQEREFLTKVNTDMPHVTGASQEEIAKALLTVSNKDAKAYEVLTTVLKSASQLIGKSDVFKEHGSNDPLSKTDEPGKSAIIAKIDAGAAELRKSNPKLTEEQAKADYLLANPALYNEYRNS